MKLFNWFKEKYYQWKMKKKLQEKKPINSNKYRVTINTNEKFYFF